MGFARLTFGQLVDRAAGQWGDREALCFEGRRRTFARPRDETDRVARVLIAATTLICADRSDPIDYPAMVEELLSGLREQPPEALAFPSAPALRCVILLSEEARRLGAQTTEPVPA
jgi:hypothetical protein